MEKKYNWEEEFEKMKELTPSQKAEIKFFIEKAIENEDNKSKQSVIEAIERCDFGGESGITTQDTIIDIIKKL